jgi:hypothetical protein
VDRRPIPYTQRILRYCGENGIEVPAGFHLRSAKKFALIDTSAQPNKLISVTSYLESWLVKYLKSDQATDRTFRILDFKKGRELEYDGSKKLKPIGEFQINDFNEPLTDADPPSSVRESSTTPRRLPASPARYRLTVARKVTVSAESVSPLRRITLTLQLRKLVSTSDRPIDPTEWLQPELQLLVVA